MSDNRQDGKKFSVLDTEDELLRADALLGKVDALLKRHKSSDADIRSGTSPLKLPSEDDLPILTDVVSDFELSANAFDAQPGSSIAGEYRQESNGEDILFSRLAEMLVQIDTDISREIEVWIMRELPQIINRELDSLSERIRAEALAQLRATLLPALSEQISSRLDRLDR